MAIDYKEEITRQKTYSAELITAFVLLAGMAIAAIIGGYFGVGVYGYSSAQPYLQKTDPSVGGFGYTPAERMAEMILLSSFSSAGVGAILALASCAVAYLSYESFKKDMEKRYKIKLK